jgi:branched-chain amino acid transport system permease protein
MTHSDQMRPNALSHSLKTALQIGSIGGIVAVSIALQGMMQAFSVRDIISGVISLSQTLLLITFFGAAYVALSRTQSKNPVFALIVGVISGLVASAFPVILVWLGTVIPLGQMFISATQVMYDLLTFKQGAGTGSIALLLLGGACGIVAAVLVLLPVKLRGAVLGGLIAVFSFGLLEDLIKTTLSNWPLFTPITNFLYKSNGLAIEGALALFLLFVAISLVRSIWGPSVSQKVNALPAASRRTLRGGSIGIAVVLLLLLPVLLGLYISDVLDTVGLYLVMGLGLNIVVGFAGLLDLGYVAFYAIGSYTVGILTSPEHVTGIIHNWWLAFPFGIIMAVFAGIILGIPVLRMRGDYLAIVTLGFGEIIRLLAISDFMKPIEGGAQGIQGIPTPDIGPIQFVQQQINLPLLGTIQFTPSQMFFYIYLAACVLVIFISMRVKNSRLGRAWMAVREDEDVAQAMGINLVATKLMAFGMGASFGGLAGAIFASKLQSVYPTSFSFIVSINVLALIIIGGMGNIPGVIVGALVLMGLPELLREVGDYRYLFYGIGLVVMMLTRPEGLFPEARRRLELEEFREDGEKPPPPPPKEPVVLKTMGQP